MLEAPAGETDPLLLRALQILPELSGASLRLRRSSSTLYVDGSVANYAQKRAVEQALRVHCSLPVVSHLAVAPVGGCVDPQVRAELLRRLTTDPRVRPRNLAVAVREGVVILDGEAHSERERQLLEEHCWSVGGVVGVQNRVSVPRHRRECENCCRRIEAGIREALTTPPNQVRCQFEGGRFRLLGWVADPRHRLVAEDVAHWYAGDAEVLNEIQLGPPTEGTELFGIRGAA